MKLLSIETTCDETAFSIADTNEMEFRLLGDEVLSQVNVHKDFGGVVPNLSAREHLKNFIPLLEKLQKKSQISLNEIDVYCVANGPGLIPALLIGVTIAKSLSYFYKKPLIPIHHIESHIFSNWLTDKGSLKEGVEFPILSLVVSGGHTELIYSKKPLKYEILGKTLDDACGEAFDKVAKMLDLGYPGGPLISKLALDGNEKKYSFPIPMIKDQSLNFSFSGLKTAVLYQIKKEKKPLSLKTKADISASFEDACIRSLIIKTKKAITKYRPKTVMLAGGVSANQKLREQFEKLCQNNNAAYSIPLLKYCGDNAAMHLVSAYFRIKQNGLKYYNKNSFKIEAKSDLKLN